MVVKSLTDHPVALLFEVEQLLRELTGVLLVLRVENDLLPLLVHPRLHEADYLVQGRFASDEKPIHRSKLIYSLLLKHDGASGFLAAKVSVMLLDYTSVENGQEFFLGTWLVHVSTIFLFFLQIIQALNHILNRTSCFPLDSRVLVESVALLKEILFEIFLVSLQGLFSGQN